MLYRHTKMSLINAASQHAQSQHQQTAGNPGSILAHANLSSKHDIDFYQQRNATTYYTQFSTDILHFCYFS